MNKLLSTAALSLSLFAGCAAMVGEDDPLPDTLDDGKADSLNSPTNHNDYFFDTRVDAEVGGSARYHAWQFKLTGQAKVDFQAVNSDFVHATDTTLYLYKKSSGTTWKRLVTSGGDEDADPRLVKDLGQGTYRVIVKGKTKTTEETTSLWGTCDGDGCLADYSGCLFGSGGLTKVPDSYVTVADDEPYTITADAVETPESGNFAAIIDAWSIATGWAGNRPAIDEVFADIKRGKVETREAMSSSADDYRLFEFETRSGKKVSGFFQLSDGNVAGAAAVMVGSNMKACYKHAPSCLFGSRLDSMGDGVTEVSHRTLTRAADMDALDRQRVIKLALNLGASAGVDVETALATFGPVEVSDLLSNNELGFNMYTFKSQATDAPTSIDGLIFDLDSTDVAARVRYNAIDLCRPTTELTPPAL